MKQNRISGLIGAFVIVGVVLVVAALVVLYGVRQYAINRNSPPIAAEEVSVPPAQLQDQNKQEPATKTEIAQKAEEKPKEKAKETIPQQKPEEKPKETSVPSHESAPSQAPQTAPSVLTQPVSSPAAEDDLPRAGLSDSIVPALATGFLAASTVAYLRSRRV